MGCLFSFSDADIHPFLLTAVFYVSWLMRLFDDSSLGKIRLNPLSRGVLSAGDGGSDAGAGVKAIDQVNWAPWQGVVGVLCGRCWTNPRGIVAGTRRLSTQVSQV